MFYRSSPTVQRCLGHSPTCRARRAYLPQWHLTGAQSRTFFECRSHNAEGIRENTLARSRQPHLTLEIIYDGAVTSGGNAQVKPPLTGRAKETKARLSSGPRTFSAEWSSSEKSEFYEHIGDEAVEIDCGNADSSSTQPTNATPSIAFIEV